MRAAILAAGLGTRLRPLTDRRPKALLPILNRPLLGVLLGQLQAAGFTGAAVNTHHLAPLVEEFLSGNGPWGLEVQVSREPELLGTGGGLRRLGEILGEWPFLAINGDILTDVDLAAVFSGHDRDAVSTLVLHEIPPPYNNVWVAGEGVVAIGGEPPQGAAAQPLGYTGIQVVSRKILKYLPDRGPYNLVTAWRQALAAGERLAALVVSRPFWQDLGTPDTYLAAHRRLLAGEAPPLARFFPSLTDPLLGPGTVVDREVQFGGGVSLGAAVAVGARAFLKNTVAWERARIAPGVSLEGCVVAAGVTVRQPARERVII